MAGRGAVIVAQWAVAAARTCGFSERPPTLAEWIRHAAPMFPSRTCCSLWRTAAACVRAPLPGHSQRLPGPTASSRVLIERIRSGGVTCAVGRVGCPHRDRLPARRRRWVLVTRGTERSSPGVLPDDRTRWRCRAAPLYPYRARGLLIRENSVPDLCTASELGDAPPRAATDFGDNERHSLVLCARPGERLRRPAMLETDDPVRARVARRAVGRTGETALLLAATG